MECLWWGRVAVVFLILKWWRLHLKNSTWLSDSSTCVAWNLMKRCSLFLSEQPEILQTLPTPLVLKHHINIPTSQAPWVTFSTRFTNKRNNSISPTTTENVLTTLLIKLSKTVVHWCKLQNTSVYIPWYSLWWSTGCNTSYSNHTDLKLVHEIWESVVVWFLNAIHDRCSVDYVSF